MFQRADEYNFQDEVTGCLSIQCSRENKVCVCPQLGGDASISGAFSSILPWPNFSEGKANLQVLDGDDPGQPSDPPLSHLTGH